MPRYAPAPLPAGYTLREDSQRRFQGEAPNGDRSTWYTRRQGAVDWCWKHQQGRLASQRTTSARPLRSLP